MSPDVVANKRELRADMRRRRDAMPAAVRARASRLACEALAGLPELERASIVAGFVAIGSELDPAAALASARARGAVAVVPRVAADARPRLRFHVLTDATELRPGAFGVREPVTDAPEVPAAALELVVLPGLAFDARGGRLGYGGGYYDELLASLGPQPRATLVGLCFDAQLVDRCPREPRDASVDVIVTDARIIRCASAARQVA